VKAPTLVLAALLLGLFAAVLWAVARVDDDVDCCGPYPTGDGDRVVIAPRATP
jgi:hypothetical protein